MPERAEIRQVRKAARKAAVALDELTASIRQARQAGLPLREIAEAAGYSHETVRKLAG